MSVKANKTYLNQMSTEEYLNDLAKKLEMHKERKAAEDRQCRMITAQIKELIGDDSVVETPNYKITNTVRVTRKFDTKTFKELCEALYTEYSYDSVSNTLTVTRKRGVS